MRVTYGNSITGEVDVEHANAVQLTYLLLRDDNDRMLAEYKADRWVRHDMTEWTDINVDAERA